jgi:hypothetical protein
MSVDVPAGTIVVDSLLELAGRLAPPLGAAASAAPSGPAATGG